MSKNEISRNWLAVQAHFRTGAGPHRSQERAEGTMEQLIMDEAHEEVAVVDWTRVDELRQTIAVNVTRLKEIETSIKSYSAAGNEWVEQTLALEDWARDVRADIDREEAWLEALLCGQVEENPLW